MPAEVVEGVCEQLGRGHQGLIETVDAAIQVSNHSDLL